jgi:WD40 repeat protein
MAWPLSQDYNEAIQDPASAFGQPDLKAGQPVVNALGLPMPRSGNFADVYEYQGARGSRWAVKCFTREVAGLRERYAAISSHLRQARLPFTVDFEYLEQGIRIRGRWYPILKMQWVEGFLLNEFVRTNLDKPALLDGLGQIWLRMAKRLRDADIAHADLQHGNMILVPGSRVSALAVKLIDYDGMFVPALARQKSGEVGHPAYQHPQRLRQGIYNAEVDRVPLLAVACALRALTIGGKPLWERYDNGDNLLFREADLANPGQSPLFQELWNVPDPTVHDLVGHLVLGLAGPLEAAPLVQEVVNEAQTRPLSATQEQRVTAVLGPGVRVTRPVPVRTPPQAIAAIPLPPQPPAALVPPMDPLNFDPYGEEPAITTKTRRRRTRTRSKKGLYLGIGTAGGALLASVVTLLAVGLGARKDADKKTDRDSARDPAGQLLRTPDPMPPPKDRIFEKPARRPDAPTRPTSNEPTNPRANPADLPKQEPAKTPPKPPDQPLIADLHPPRLRIGVNTGFQKDYGWVGGIAFAPDGRRVITACENLVHVWDFPSGKEALRIEYPSNVQAVALSRSGSLALVGTGVTSRDGNGLLTARDCALWLWDLQARRLTKRIDHATPVHGVAFSPDGRYAASASGMLENKGQTNQPRDCVVRVWDLATSRLVQTLQGHRSWPTGVAFSRDSRSVYSWGVDFTLRSWKIDTGREDLALSQRGWPARFSPDGARTLGAEGATLKVWKNDGGIEYTFAPVKGPINVIAVSADSRRAAVGCGELLIKDGRPVRDERNRVRTVNNGVQLYDIETGNELAFCDGHPDQVDQLAFSPDGRYLLSASRETFRLWDLQTYRRPATPDLHDDDNKHRVEEPNDDITRNTKDTDRDAVPKTELAPGEVCRFTRHAGKVKCVSISGDGQTVLSGCSAGTLRLWSNPTGRQIKVLQPEPGSIDCVVLTADGQRAVSGGAHGNVRQWDLATGNHFLVASGRSSSCIALFPQEDFALIGDQDGRFVKVPVEGTGPPDILTYDQKWGRLGSVALARNGNLAAFVDGHGVVHTYDSSKQHPRGTLTAYSVPVRSVALSRNGRLLFTGANDRTIRLWDYPTGTPRGLLKGHKQAVTSLALSADGKRLLSGSDDKTVRLWDLKSRKLLKTFTGHLGKVTSVALSGDGRYAVSGSEDKTVRVWRLPK